MNNTPIKFAYFGSSRLSVIVLDELEKVGHIPAVIVTTPDKPKGRKLIVTPNVVKEWGLKKGVKVFDPAKLDTDFIASLTAENCELFIVASYGKIIPNAVLDLPKHKTLNIHPSLLPKYRGPSPLPSAILDDEKNTGVSIMCLDHEMDHGPIVAQEKVSITEWPTYEDFEENMAKIGAQLLARTMPDWVDGKIEEKEQDHSMATFTKKMTKEDGLIDITDTSPENSRKNFLKIQAYHEWPQAYFFINKGGQQMRVKVTQASWDNGVLNIKKVIPEGKKEMNYADFMRSM